MRRANFILSITFISLILIFFFSGSNMPPGQPGDDVRASTRSIEFDFVSWMLNAFWVKNEQSALSIPAYMSDAQQSQHVRDTMILVDQRDRLRYQIELIYSDPKIKDPAAASLDLRNKEAELTSRLDKYQPLAEEILQNQVSAVLTDLGLTTGGKPLPPLLYHTTDLPLAMIISPRNVIEQKNNISLLPNLTIEQITRLEQEVEKRLDVSALVVEVGGIGVYPTMVMSSSSLPWVSDTIAHEWIHNYLTLRPLGLNYETTPELRTMNETTASIAGNEIGEEVLRRYYPELAPPPPAPAATETTQSPPPPPSNDPPPFDFRAEMHTTRVGADELLAQGKIVEAENFMEQRRLFFWENGYRFRRLNQAYFAFHGAYADSPGGAAGEDPVGPAVRALRQRSATLVDFIDQIAWMTSFDQLLQVVKPK
ncbi:MAG: hypothetical protein HGA53_02180 [Anaerolineaceae bacterium]|nr:hypothetical protein [Anaerolineaceae bacterium]